MNLLKEKYIKLIKNGEVVNIWNCAKDAEKSINIFRSSVSVICLNLVKSNILTEDIILYEYHKFYWSFEETLDRVLILLKNKSVVQEKLCSFMELKNELIEKGILNKDYKVLKNEY